MRTRSRRSRYREARSRMNPEDWREYIFRPASLAPRFMWEDPYQKFNALLRLARHPQMDIHILSDIYALTNSTIHPKTPVAVRRLLKAQPYIPGSHPQSDKAQLRYYFIQHIDNYEIEVANDSFENKLLDLWRDVIETCDQPGTAAFEESVAKYVHFGMKASSAILPRYVQATNKIHLIRLLFAPFDAGVTELSDQEYEQVYQFIQRLSTKETVTMILQLFMMHAQAIV